MKYTFAKEYGTNIPHCTFKHGISVDTVKTYFPKPMRDMPDGNHRVRLCKVNGKTLIRIAYDWVKPNSHVKIYTAYFI